ncbi:sterol desaturase family protein [Novosphingobium sp. TH158]|uniref:sterol desaturase family protein n=1 Tax=Novosphingobium sp. TH158 TaxID=2067455 RepID=UPI000C7CC025|nr:sterol desaturase family protein [Novosphingobium sp. TH158]PLK26936.1 hypothetical protein C0V78_08580 [Novosphingobium sp. TH158]
MMQYFLLVYAGTAVLFVLEILAGRHRGAYEKGDVPLIAGSLLGRQLIGPITTGLITAAYGAVAPATKGALAGANPWLVFAGLLLLTEFVFYWVHRWAHENRKARLPLLWKLHRTHHSGRHMNIVLMFRVNVFWYLIFPAALTIALGVHLGQPAAAAGVTLALSAWNAITHCNFRWDDRVRAHPRFGPAFRALEHVFVSPGLHHTHHGYGKDGAGYRNFGTVLSLWDWLFGTLHIPEGRPWRYGNPGPTAHWSEELLYPIVRRKPVAAQEKQA